MTTKRRKRHSPKQVVRKLRDADAMRNAGKDLAAVLQALEVSEQAYHRWRNGHRRVAVVAAGCAREGYEHGTASYEQ